MGSVFDDAVTNEIVADHEKDGSKTVSEEIEIVPEKVDDLSEQAAVPEKEKTKETPLTRNTTFVFVLGGPGGGKSTQCSNLAKEIGYTHLSSGDILRRAMNSDPENGPMIEGMIKEGKSVPPDVTMRLLQKAIEESGNDKFLLDGFPRDEEIRAAFENATKVEPERVLYFECSEEERERRILGRNQGRVDDNPNSLRKRFNYFQEHTLPVVEYYESKGKVTRIDASQPVEEVSKTMKGILMPISRKQREQETPVASCGLAKEISRIKL